MCILYLPACDCSLCCVVSCSILCVVPPGVYILVVVELAVVVLEIGVQSL
jgi:hypothetical protein